MESAALYGYVRCSTKEQNEDRQVIAIREFGVSDACIVIEKMSGKDFSRPLYQALITKLQPGDTLVIKSIDRLGRGYNDILEQWRQITKVVSADIVVLDFPLLDTRQKGHDPTSLLISDLALQVLSYVAEQERLFNQQRQAEGIAAAKIKGVKFGRRPIERPEQYEEVCELWRQGEISARHASRLLSISHTTFKRWVEDK